MISCLVKGNEIRARGCRRTRIGERHYRSDKSFSPDTLAGFIESGELSLAAPCVRRSGHDFLRISHFKHGLPERIVLVSYAARKQAVLLDIPSLGSVVQKRRDPNVLSILFPEFHSPGNRHSSGSHTTNVLVKRHPARRAFIREAKLAHHSGSGTPREPISAANRNPSWIQYLRNHIALVDDTDSFLPEIPGTCIWTFLQDSRYDCRDYRRQSHILFPCRRLNIIHVCDRQELIINERNLSLRLQHSELAVNTSRPP
jgi:hypothetical protein